MGGGFYSTTRSATRSATYSGQRRDEVFRERGINKEMSPNGLAFREARDSEEHPESLPIIVALDETGSMGYIPEALVKGGLTKIMGNIMQNGIEHPQICFLGIGDHECDDAPLQVGQFESSDELLDKWLTSVYLEGNGGGNGGESYFLAWYFAARYTKTDHLEKRGKKGILITLGDELCLGNFSAKQQEVLMGNGQYEDMNSQQILKEAAEKWDVYHILVTETFSGSRRHVQDGWKQLLKDNCVLVDDYNKIPSTIAKIVAEHEGVQNVQIAETEEELVANDKYDPLKGII